MPTNSSPALNKTVTRKNSASFTLLDIQKLITESEERLIAHVNKRFDTLSAKVESLENSIKEVKAVQIQQETDIAKIKDIIVDQQHQIEAYEERERCCNLILSNVPEGSITFEKETLSTDDAKVRSLVDAIVPETMRLDVNEDILNVKRIGQSGGRSPRILKVCLSDIDCRNKILRCSRNLNSDTIRSAYGRVYANKDMSFLRRLEEKRLREAYRQLKVKFPDDTRLRNGKLFLGQTMKDRVDFKNQLF